MSRKPTGAKETAAAATYSGAHSRRRVGERLEGSILVELWSIWQADPRVPSVKSRRLWAISRNANPRLVDRWFLRRKADAKRAGQPISKDSYDLDLKPLVVPKREPSTPIKFEPDAFSDLPSDDTFVCPADEDHDASSDTAFDEDTHIDSIRLESPAYKQVLHPEHYQHSQPEPRFGAIILSFTIDSPALSSADLDNHYNTDVFFLGNTSFLVCNQGQGTQSDPTCILCSELAQGTPDVAQSDSFTMFDAREDPRLDFSPVPLSELSAIPFLFCNPPAVPPDSCQNVDDWAIVEEELSRLVRDGELDFSFLTVPHLASMELFD